MYGAMRDEGGSHTGAHAIRRSERGAEAFLSAARHSQRVRKLKFILPAVAITIAGIFFAYSLIVSKGAGPVQLDSASFEDGDLVIHNPSLDGFTSRNLPYQLTAARARQAIGSATGAIALEKIEATLPIDEKNRATIIAGAGTYDRENDRVLLSDSITLRTTSGIVAQLQSAHVDILSQDLSTDRPVEIQMDGMRVRADSFHAKDGGRRLVFENRVKVELDPARLRKE